MLKNIFSVFFILFTLPVFSGGDANGRLIENLDELQVDSRAREINSTTTPQPTKPFYKANKMQDHQRFDEPDWDYEQDSSYQSNDQYPQNIRANTDEPIYNRIAVSDEQALVDEPSTHHADKVLDNQAKHLKLGTEKAGLSNEGNPEVIASKKVAIHDDTQKNNTWADRLMRDVSVEVGVAKNYFSGSLLAKFDKNMGIRLGYTSASKLSRDDLQSVGSGFPSTVTLGTPFLTGQLEYTYLFAGVDVNVFSICRNFCIEAYVGARGGQFNEDVVFSLHTNTTQNDLNKYDNTLEDELKEFKAVFSGGIRISPPKSKLSVGINLETLPDFTDFAKTYIGQSNDASPLKFTNNLSTYLSQTEVKDAFFDKAQLSFFVSYQF